MGVSLSQDGFDRRFEWGLDGARSLAAHVDVVIVVDVFSFSTAVDVATSRGAAVAPFAWADERAAAYAREIDAYLAVGRSQVSEEHPFSLSPVSLQRLPEGSRLVLPSPNGASICAEIASTGIPVFAGCLRNVRVVAAAAQGHGPVVGVVAAGEQWSGGALRPALEDLVGAGSVLAALPGPPSPEARAAIKASETSLGEVRDCASARELAALGYEGDIELATETDTSTAAPLLLDGLFHAA